MLNIGYLITIANNRPSKVWADCLLTQNHYGDKLHLILPYLSLTRPKLPFSILVKTLALFSLCRKPFSIKLFKTSSQYEQGYVPHHELSNGQLIS